MLFLFAQVVILAYFAYQQLKGDTMGTGVETFKSNGCDIEIQHDLDATNPRVDFDTISVIYYLSGRGRYTLGDKEVASDDFMETWDEKKKTEKYVYPMYAYIHSGIALSLSPFSDPWDSMTAGFVVVPEDRAKELLGDNFTEEDILLAVENELETFQSFINGECYGYTISRLGIELSACWGYFSVERARDDAAMEATSVALQDPPVRLRLQKGEDEFSWTNIGDDANTLFINNTFTYKCETLEDALGRVSTFKAEEISACPA